MTAHPTPVQPAAPHPRPGAAYAAVTRALKFAGLVRDEGPDSLGLYLDKLDRGQLYGLTVALAAMVPEDQTPEDLLAWINNPEEGAVA